MCFQGCRLFAKTPLQACHFINLKSYPCVVVWSSACHTNTTPKLTGHCKASLHWGCVSERIGKNLYSSMKSKSSWTQNGNPGSCLGKTKLWHTMNTHVRSGFVLEKKWLNLTPSTSCDPFCVGECYSQHHVQLGVCYDSSQGIGFLFPFFLFKHCWKT